MFTCEISQHRETAIIRISLTQHGPPSPPKVLGKRRKCNEKQCGENPSDVDLFVHGEKEEKDVQWVIANDEQLVKRQKEMFPCEHKRWKQCGVYCCVSCSMNHQQNT